jgi:hypothetical protein
MTEEIICRNWSSIVLSGGPGLILSWEEPG